MGLEIIILSKVSDRLRQILTLILKLLGMFSGTSVLMINPSDIVIDAPKMSIEEYPSSFLVLAVVVLNLDKSHRLSEPQFLICNLGVFSLVSSHRDQGIYYG